MKIVLDTETTGLLVARQDFLSQPGIVQIGAVKLNDALEEVDSFNCFVNPEKGANLWEPKAIETHGITPEMVKDAPSFFSIAQTLAEFIVGCDVWVGFNNQFDKQVIRWQLLRYGLETRFPWPPFEHDVMKLSGDKMETEGKRGVKNPKLAEAFEFFVGGTFANAHDALADVRATAAVYRKVIQ